MSAALIAGLAAAGPAMAQVAGTYTGTAKDGSPVSFTVTTDTSTGSLAITSVSIDYTAPCKNETYTLYSGIGYGPTADITNGAVSSTIDYPNIYVTFSLKFAKNGQTATGLEEVIAPALYSTTALPARAIFCESARQAMSVSLQKTPPPATTPLHYLYDNRGRIIGEVLR